MAKLDWGDAPDNTSLGLDRGVLQVPGQPAVAWPGLVQTRERFSGGDPDPVYMDGVKIDNQLNLEEFELSIRAYFSPKEFDACEGQVDAAPGLLLAHQERLPFHFSYRTSSAKTGEQKIHIVYNALAKPLSKTYSSMSDQISLEALTWDCTTQPEELEGYSPSSKLTIRLSKVSPFDLQFFENVLYGTSTTDPMIPDFADVIDMFTPYNVIDNGDGSFSITDRNINLAYDSTGTFTHTNSDITIIDANSYSITYS